MGTGGDRPGERAGGRLAVLGVTLREETKAGAVDESIAPSPKAACCCERATSKSARNRAPAGFCWSGVGEETGARAPPPPPQPVGSVTDHVSFAPSSRWTRKVKKLRRSISRSCNANPSSVASVLLLLLPPLPPPLLLLLPHSMRYSMRNVLLAHCASTISKPAWSAFKVSSCFISSAGRLVLPLRLSMTRLLRTCPCNLCCSSCRCERRTPAYWFINVSDVVMLKRDLDYCWQRQLRAQPCAAYSVAGRCRSTG